MNQTAQKKQHPSPASGNASDADYKVGPGRPPKEHQFQRGQSGNPKGRPKQSAIDLDLKAALQNALNKQITLRQGEAEKVVSMAVAGIEQLVTQYVKGDRHARRDLIGLADKLGVDLFAGQRETFEGALAPDLHTIVMRFADRQYDRGPVPPPVIAPPELLDDDVTEGRS